MGRDGRWWTVLRSLLALVLAIAAIPAVNLAGAWLSDRLLGLPPGGDLRLAVDLFWVFMAGVTGTWLMVRTRRWPRGRTPARCSRSTSPRTCTAPSP